MDKKPHSDNKFKQQDTPHFYTRHSAKTVISSLLVTAIIFIPLGAAIVVASDSIFELNIRYDDVQGYKYTTSCATAYSFAFNGSTTAQGCNTKKVFTLAKSVPQPISLSYRLVQFHQNYRQYATSRDDRQLAGQSTDPASYCNPIRVPGDTVQRFPSIPGSSLTYSSFVYSPCGLIAWSMFNDTIDLYKVPSAAQVVVTNPVPSNAQVVCLGSKFDAKGNSLNSSNLCKKTGIALTPDVKTRFADPGGSMIWTGAGNATSQDPYLAGGYYAFEPAHRIPSATDEDFIVWARTASMPDFRKLYRIITQDLPAGDYLLDIGEFFDVASFNGEKHVIIATTSWIGGTNYVLGVSVLVMGCLSFVLAIAVVVVVISRNSKKNAM